VQIEHSHSLPHDEAKARARALAEYLSTRHGMQIDWKSDDAFSMRGKYMIVSIDVNVKVDADRVHVTGKDPGMLWRGKAKSYIEHKLSRYMDPSQPLEALPRG
jgi:hypothetical protein